MILLAIALAGCAASGKAFIGAEHAYSDFFAPIEGLPPNAKTLQKASLRDVLAGGPGWTEYEIGRRFDEGVGGLPRDPACARQWYERAARSPYEYLDWSGASGPRPTRVTRIGLPFARIALRKLDGKVQATGPAPDDSPRCQAIFLNAVNRG